MVESAELKRAWEWRGQSGWMADENPAVRIFYGPGEGTGILESVAVDRFGDHYWITVWDDEKGTKGTEAAAAIVRFLRGLPELESRPMQSAVLLFRPVRDVPEDPVVVFGKPPAERFEVREGASRYLIQLQGAKHPGLFLDHRPLREWLITRARGWNVLNTFAYTGSLSVASGLGGAQSVTTLDLSKSSVSWAEQNWKINGLSGTESRFISGDVFEWLPRLKREKRRYDCVILDPPSFARGPKGNFSTARDLKKLHLLALDVLAPEGVLITSINSANVSWARYEADVLGAARERGIHFEILQQIDLPDTFPTPLGKPDRRYLKGWILKAQARN